MMQKKTILIIDDTEANIETLTALLGEQYDLLISLSGREALALLDEEHVDLVLLDIVLPGMDGFEVCRRIKAEKKTQDIPVIFITVKSDEDSIERAYELGGVDYITKPFRSREVLSRIKKELTLQTMLDELAHLASTDPLTKLYNRRHFSKISQHALALAKREQEALSVIMLDIDRFKRVNDTYGHQAGDEVIMHLAKTIMAHLRQSDFACRFGGEEFVVLLPNTSIDDARYTAEKLRKAVEENAAILSNGEAVYYTVSLGVSTVDLKSESLIDSALKRADEALFLAKEHGRNLVR